MPHGICPQSVHQSSRVRESKTVMKSGFQDVDSRFNVMDSRLSASVLGFRITIIAEFRIFWAVFRMPKPRIPETTSKNFSHSGIRSEREIIWPAELDLGISAFRTSFHSDWQINNGVFDRSILTRIQILVHKWGTRTRISALFRRQSLVSTMAHAKLQFVDNCIR